MTYKLIISKEAHKDIDGIVSYIANELKNPQAASDFLDDIEQSYRRIADNPFVYSLCNDKRLRQQGYHKAVIKNYLVIYRLDEDKAVYIARVVYAARNYIGLL